MIELRMRRLRLPPAPYALRETRVKFIANGRWQGFAAGKPRRFASVTS